MTDKQAPLREFCTRRRRPGDAGQGARSDMGRCPASASASVHGLQWSEVRIHGYVAMPKPHQSREEALPTARMPGRQDTGRSSGPSLTPRGAWMERVPSARGCLAEVRENMHPRGPGTGQEGKNARGNVSGKGGSAERLPHRQDQQHGLRSPSTTSPTRSDLRATTTLHGSRPRYSADTVVST